MLVDDGQLEVVVPVHLGLDVQALLERPRADADRVPLLHLAQDVLGVLGVDGDLPRQVLDREVRRLLAVLPLGALEVEKAVVVEVADDELGERPLLVREVAHLELPAEVIDERGPLREVLLDGGKLLEAAAVARQGLLQRPVLQELLPVDLLDPLVLRPLLQVRHVELLGGHRRGVGTARLNLDGAVPVLRVPVCPRSRVDLFVCEHGVGVELLADFVDELEPRELEKADGLLQLRRHDELLAEL